MANAGTITAVLTLNSSGFQSGLSKAITSLVDFKTNANAISNTVNKLRQVLTTLENSLVLNADSLANINNMLANNKNFVSFANAVNNIAKALRTLSSDAVNVETGMNVINSILQQLQSVAGNSTIKVQGLTSALRSLKAEENSGVQAMTQYKLGATNVQRATDSMSNSTKQGRQNLALYHQNLKALALGVEQFNSIQTNTARAVEQNTNSTRQAIATEQQYRVVTLQTDAMLERKIASLQRNSQAMRENGAEILRNMGYKGKLSIEDEKASMSEQKLSQSVDKGTNSLKRQETATKSLSRAFSSLKMMGTMVGSMIAYNFVHNLAMATTETINAKSEMNGYFQMLGYTTGQVNHFNKALEETVQKFPRLNKYALGETISSIGVEFELTTKEMEKAMPVVSMITSEYLRAGRNVNEASLAVKDILQGEFQRLSRETGVKQDTLKEAGWSGDKTDVMGLLEALDKVGKARHWDTFVQKANSLNDAVLILQNRFSEWSADMVETVQPAILSVFNSLLSFSEGLSQSLTGLWQWLNGDSWGATATQIGLLGGAILTVSQAFSVYRTGLGLVQTTQMGLSKQIASTILGLKGQQLAETGVLNAIRGKILGVKAETIAESGVTRAIQERMTMTKLETVEERLNTLSSEENTTAKKYLALQEKINSAEKKGLIASTEAHTLAQELETAMTGEQVIANGGLTASLYLLGTGEVYVAGETTALATAMGVLNGVFMLSPIGWITAGILALAGAFYVLSGGLSDTWDKMKQFNEVMKDPHDTINTYKDRVSSLNTKLEEAKSKYGENSSEVEKLEGKLNTAKETLESVQGAVEHGVYWNDKYNESFEELGATMDSSLREVMKSHGYSKTQIDKTGQLLDAMDLGTNKVYRALQVMHKQQDDASKSLDEYADSLDHANIKGDEASEKMSNYAKNLENLQTHSAIANTTDDWWEWMWNSLYAGLDQMWIDIDEFFVNFDWSKLLNDEGNQLIDGLVKGFNDGIANWQSGARDWIDGVVEWLSDGFDYIVSLDWLPEFDLWGAISGWIGTDADKGLSKSIGLDGNSILDMILPDISVDGAISWISNLINNSIVIPLTNFASDPLGTLSSWGLPLPQIDLGGLIQGLFNIGGEGGFDIGGWLSSIFNIDSIVSTFTTNLGIIFTTASTVATNVGNVFNNLKNMIWGHIQGILSNVSTTFNNIKNTAVTQINGLSSGIKGGIDKVVSAFNYMKDCILNSAKAIYDGVKAKFDSVKTTIGDFWNKLTNPSSWGSAGSESYQRRSPKPQTARRMFAGSPVVRSAIHHGAGVNPYTNDSQTVKLKDLMNMVNGDNKVKLSDFLAMFSEGGFGTWDFHEPVKKKVFDTAKGYKTGSPNIKGIGTVGDGYKVEKFWDGKPKFAFEEFQAVAQAIFSAIPYKFYYDSEWKGSWVNALLSGAVNCSDGADALIALARVFGFDGYKQHTTLKSGVGHFFAVIGGKKMDTTNFQNHGSWSPLGGAGIPTRRANPSGYAGETHGKTVNITVSMDNAVIYGVDDLDSRIQDSVQKGIQQEFNDPYTVAI